MATGVNVQDRARLARALRAFATGKTTNFEFEEAVSFGSEDAAVNEMILEAWYLYDDLTEHRLRGHYALAPEGRRVLARWLLFLRTNQRFDWPRRRRGLVACASGAALASGLAATVAGLLGHSAAGILVPPAYVAAVFGVVLDSKLHMRRLHRFGADLDLWPFVRGSDLKAAMDTWPQWAARPS